MHRPQSSRKRAHSSTKHSMNGCGAQSQPFPAQEPKQARRLMDPVVRVSAHKSSGRSEEPKCRVRPPYCRDVLFGLVGIYVCSPAAATMPGMTSRAGRHPGRSAASAPVATVRPEPLGSPSGSRGQCGRVTRSGPKIRRSARSWRSWSSARARQAARTWGGAVVVAEAGAGRTRRLCGCALHDAVLGLRRLWFPPDPCGRHGDVHGQWSTGRADPTPHGVRNPRNVTCLRVSKPSRS